MRIGRPAILWSLGMALAVGVLVTFAAESDDFGRVVGMSAALLVIVGLLARPMLLLARHRVKSWTGRLGLVLIFVNIPVALVLLWKDELFPTDASAVLWPTLRYFLLTGGPAGVLLLFWHHPGTWLAARVGLLVCLTEFVEFMAVLVYPSMALERLSRTAPATLWFGLLAIVCLLGSPGKRRWRYLGIPACGVAWAAATFGVFLSATQELWSIVHLFLAGVAAVAVLIAYANLLHLPPLTPREEVIRRCTIAFAIMTIVAFGLNDALRIGASHLGFLKFVDAGFLEAMESLGRVAGGLTGFGTFAIVVLALDYWVRNWHATPTSAVNQVPSEVNANPAEASR